MSDHNIYHGRPVPHLCGIFDHHTYCLTAIPINLIQEYNIGSVGRTHIYIPSAAHRVVPLVQPFVHVGGTRCATIFD